jgi:hypothetical protein
MQEIQEIRELREMTRDQIQRSKNLTNKDHMSLADIKLS